ncbi:hypothetical protein [Saccharothrix stipae]
MSGMAVLACVALDISFSEPQFCGGGTVDLVPSTSAGPAAVTVWHHPIESAGNPFGCCSTAPDRRIL